MLTNKIIAILGYGSQGRAWALNLKDSGCNIIIGLPKGSKSRRKAISDGMNNITAASSAVIEADIIIFALPDHLHGRVFEKEIRPNLKHGSALVFLHGFSIHFKIVTPPRWCDIVLLAPLSPGIAVRENFMNDGSIGYFYAIHRNFSGEAKKTIDFLVKTLRIDKKKLIKTTFADETIGDIFGEQAVLCGGLSQLIKAGFDTLVESGLSPDKAYLEVAYQLDLIIDLIKKFGIAGMLERISFTARFGSLRAGPLIIDKHVKAKMKKALALIRNGKFAKELSNLDESGFKRTQKNLKHLTSPSFEKSARKFSPVRDTN